MLNAEIIGLEGLKKDLSKYSKEAQSAIDTAVEQTMLAIETDAKRRLSGMFGSQRHVIFANLQKSIFKRKEKDMEGVVGTNVHYAPYIEFGTGEKVFTNFDFDDNAKKVATQFKGKKKVKGIRGDSFLNWAAVNQSKKLIERITEQLNKLNK